MVYQLTSIAKVIRAIIHNAEQFGLRVDDGNVTNLLDTNLLKDISWIDISSALDVAGFKDRFPISIHKMSFRV
jgi:hypothetical protein